MQIKSRNIITFKVTTEVLYCPR